MRFIKSISGWLWLIISIILLVLLLQKFNLLPSFREIFKTQQVSIDETPLVIQQIRSIAELNTASLYHEFVIDSTVPSIIPLQSLKKRLVLIAKGKVTAGVNLQLLDSSRMFVKGDSVSIQLPGAAVTGVELNPSSFETFYENGRWSGAEVSAVKMKARQILIKEATRRKLVKSANENAKRTVTDFLHAAGFTRINVY